MVFFHFYILFRIKNKKLNFVAPKLPKTSHSHVPLKVPKREIFDRTDFPDFYTIKSSWVGDLVVKILTYYFNF